MNMFAKHMYFAKTSIEICIFYSFAKDANFAITTVVRNNKYINQCVSFDCIIK